MKNFRLVGIYGHAHDYNSSVLTGHQVTLCDGYTLLGNMRCSLGESWDFMLFFSVNSFFLKICICVSVCIYVHMSAGAHRGQKGASDPPELELQEVVRHLTWCWEHNQGSL